MMATDPKAMQEDVVSDEEGFEEATPEEQAQYEEFVLGGIEMISGGGEVKPGILKMLDEDPSDLKKALGDQEAFKDFTPGVALAATAVVIVLELVRTAGKDAIADAVILHGGKAILEELASVSAEAGFHDFSEDELNRSFYIALDLYREAAVAEGLLDPSGLAEEFEQIKAADAQGAFGGGEEPAKTLGGIGPKA